MPMDIREYNRRAWDRAVGMKNEWTVPVSPEATARARQGDWEVLLTPLKPVPRAWFGPLTGARVLCLASGGGQQGPILSAAGGLVTVLDNSPAQLAQDRMVAGRDGLELAVVEGDMCDLASHFPEESFDLIFHPVSNCFVEDPRRVWHGCFRVLKPGGVLLAGFCNPLLFAFDPDLEKQGVLTLKYAIPYSDVTSLTDGERARYVDAMDPLSFGHSLEDQIGGQLDAGFVLRGYYDDWHRPEDPTARYFPAFGATWAQKP